MFRLLASSFLFFALVAIAPGSAAATEAAPFGLILGKTQRSELSQLPAGAARWHDSGRVSLLDGPILESDGAGLDLPGLRDAMLVFAGDGTLHAVILTLSKEARGENLFDYYDQLLGEKYERESRTRPFVGNAHANYRAGNARIRLSAPHLSFQMELVFATPEAFAAAQAQQDAAERERRAREASAL